MDLKSIKKSIARVTFPGILLVAVNPRYKLDHDMHPKTKVGKSKMNRVKVNDNLQIYRSCY